MGAGSLYEREGGLDERGHLMLGGKGLALRIAIGEHEAHTGESESAARALKAHGLDGVAAQVHPDDCIGRLAEHEGVFSLARGNLGEGLLAAILGAAFALPSGLLKIGVVLDRHDHGNGLAVSLDDDMVARVHRAANQFGEMAF